MLGDAELHRVVLEGLPYWTALQTWHGCLRKRYHTTEEAAHAAAAETMQRTGTEVGAYSCPYSSGHWHIGRESSNDPGQMKRNIANDLRKQRRQGSLQVRGYRFPPEKAYPLLPFLAPPPTAHRDSDPYS